MIKYIIIIYLYGITLGGDVREYKTYYTGQVFDSYEQCETFRQNELQNHVKGKIQSSQCEQREVKR